MILNIKHFLYGKSFQNHKITVGLHNIITTSVPYKKNITNKSNIKISDTCYMNLEIVKQGIQIMSRLLLNACTCFTQSPCKRDFTKNLQNVGSCDTVL